MGERDHGWVECISGRWGEDDTWLALWRGFGGVGLGVFVLSCRFASAAGSSPTACCECKESNTARARRMTRSNTSPPSLSVITRRRRSVRPASTPTCGEYELMLTVGRLVLRKCDTPRNISQKGSRTPNARQHCVASKTPLRAREVRYLSVLGTRDGGPRSDTPTLTLSCVEQLPQHPLSPQLQHCQISHDSFELFHSFPSTKPKPSPISTTT